MREKLPSLRTPTPKKREVLGVPVTPNKNLLYYDDLDGRKCMCRALARLDDRKRLAFVNWCCRQQGRFDRAKAVATVAYRGMVYYTVDDALSDLSQLTLLGGGGGVEADVVLAELERRARLV